MNVSLGIACAVPDQTGYLLIVAFDIMLVEFITTTIEWVEDVDTSYGSWLCS